NSAAWRQMVADVFQLPVEVPTQPEGAAFGAALQALWASTTDGSPAALAQLVREHVQTDAALAASPDVDAAEPYAGAYREFLRQLDAARRLHSGAAGGG